MCSIWVYAGLGIKPRVLYSLGKCSTDWTTCPALARIFSRRKIATNIIYPNESAKHTPQLFLSLWRSRQQINPQQLKIHHKQALMNVTYWALGLNDTAHCRVLGIYSCGCVLDSGVCAVQYSKGTLQHMYCLGKGQDSKFSLHWMDAIYLLLWNKSILNGAILCL